MWDATPALVRKILKLVGVVLVVFLGYAGISNTFFHSAAVAGTPLKLKTQLGDDGRSLPVVDRAAHQADRWLRDEFGHRISKQTNIRLARSGNCVYVENLVVETQDSTGWQGTGGICLYTERSKWKAMLAGDDGRDAEEFVIHELIHSAQTELGCVDDSGESRFRWLMEGMAVYGAREAQVSSGRRRSQETDAYIRGAGGYSPDLDPLERFETAEGDSAAYQHWHRAVRRLADRHGGVAAQREFCAAVGRGREWRAAFTGAFGLSPATFYAEFERARR